MDKADDVRAVFDNAHVEHREGRTEHSAQDSHNDRRQKHNYVHRQHAAHLQPANLTSLSPAQHVINGITANLTAERVCAERTKSAL